MSENWQINNIKEMWTLRTNGNILRASDLFIKEVVRIGYPLNASVLDKYNFIKGKIDIKFLLLDISFKRSALKVKTALDEALALESLLTGDRHFQRDGFFFFQMGLFYLGVGLYSKAFDQFIQVRKTNSELKDYLYGRFSLILTMEALGYQYDEYLMEFESDFSPYNGQAEYESLLQQFLALKIRYHFFIEQNFSRIEELIGKYKIEGQGYYLLNFISQLPCFDVDKIKKYIEDNGVLVKEKHWLNAYRTRTFSELLVEDDLKDEVKLESVIERLYLWTWRWLMEPNTNLFYKIGEIIKYLSKRAHEQEVTHEHYQMLENSFLWISLFQGARTNWYDEILKEINYAKVRPCEFFDYEKKIVQIYIARRDKRNVVADDMLLESPGTMVPQFILPKLLASDNLLSRGLQSLINEKISISKGVVIDFSSMKVSFLKNNKLVRCLESEHLVKLFNTFENKLASSKQEILLSCFGLKDFNYDIHSNKLANLLSKANKELQGLGKFQIRQDIVRITGNFKIEVLGACEHTTHCYPFWETIEVKKSVSSEESSKLKLEKLADKWFSRKELEDLLKFSKSNATRRINQWCKEKILLKKGLGKKTKYYFVDNAKDMFV